MSRRVQAAPQPRGLSAGHFRRIARQGIGDAGNSYAYSYAWYDEHVYIGTIRHLLVLIRKRFPFEMPSQMWPVPVPESDADLDLCAQILRYSPRTGLWERVYRSPMTKGLNDRDVPLAIGFRNMAVFQGRSDSRPAIYTIASCGSYGLGPVLLRAADGVNFEPVSEPGLGLGDSNLTTFRGVYPFKGRLFMAPSGSRGGHCNAAYNAVILCGDDPARGRWQPSSPPGFGDSTNLSVFDFCACGDSLYASTANLQGFQIWKTDAEGPPPHRWSRVLDQGADRGSLSESVLAMAAFQGNLYLGTAVNNGGFDKINNIGPAAAEIIRVYPDDTWDLVVGQPRMTRQGLKVPSSGYGPGFDNPCAGYMWRLCQHDGALYAGTYDSSSFAPYSDLTRWPAWSARLAIPEIMQRFLEVRGGCELWRSVDGDHWVPITRNGFNNPFNYGIRTLLSTPYGLFVGSANPFGPKVAIRGPAGWRYEDNPRGGVEVWHGSLEHAGCGPTEDLLNPDTDPVAWLRDEGYSPCESLGSLLNGAGPASAPLPAAEAERRQELSDYLAGRDDPVLRLALADKHLVGLAEDVEHELAAYFGHSPLRNAGYWRSNGTTPRQACQQLLGEVLGMIPAGAAAPAAALAVGIGADAMAAELRRRWPAVTVTSLVPDPPSRPAPDRRDPTVAVAQAACGPLGVPDAAFDLVVWIEGSGALGLGAAWGEVRRVLKPGGRLVASELIGYPIGPKAERGPAAASAELLADYQRDLERAGLVEIRLIDMTLSGWFRFYQHSRDHLATKLLFRQLDQEQHDRILDALPGGRQAIASHVLVAAVKPQEM